MNNNLNMNNNNLNPITNNSQIGQSNQVNPNNVQNVNENTNVYYQQTPVNDNKSKPKNRKKLLLILIIIAILIILVGLFILKQQKNNDNNIETNNELINEENELSPIGKYTIYLNDLEIKLGITTIDYVKENTNLKVIYDKADESCYVNGECNKNREIILSDGINKIEIITLNNSDKIKSFSTIESTDEPDFELSTGTKIVFIDKKWGKNISIGDSFTEDEFWEYELNMDTAWGGLKDFYVSQTKYLGNDCFAYFFDENNKIVNMWATLNYME